MSKKKAAIDRRGVQRVLRKAGIPEVLTKIELEGCRDESEFNWFAVAVHNWELHRSELRELLKCKHFAEIWWSTQGGTIDLIFDKYA